VILGRVGFSPYEAGADPGTVVGVDKESFAIATGDGALFIYELQPAGKRQLSAGEFLRGYPIRVGDRFGPANPAAT
jgi:methionyl-tRNA formyltransferase